MTGKTGFFRRLEAFEKLMVAANAEASVAVAYRTEKESSEEFWEAVEALAEESEQLRRKVAGLLDAAGNENLDLWFDEVQLKTRPSTDSIMIPIMPAEEFQKLSEEEQNAQWDRELDSMTEEDWDRFQLNCTGRHLGDPIPPGELVDADEFFENPDAFL
jgi:hypothetical protein